MMQDAAIWQLHNTAEQLFTAYLHDNVLHMPHVQNGSSYPSRVPSNLQNTTQSPQISWIVCFSESAQSSATFLK